jgi:hypothetical protein
VGLYDRDYMRRARTENEARTGRPAWLDSAPVRRCTGPSARGLWAVVTSGLIWAANRHWHLLEFHLHR